MRHDQPYFYKYLSAEGLIATLSTQCLRLRKPEFFNDPFDSQHDIVLPAVDKDQMAELYMDELRRSVVEGDGSPSGLPNLVTKDQIRRRKHVFENDDLFEQYKKDTAHVTYEVYDEMTERMNAGLKAHLKESFVYCLSETRESMQMWSHYADHHKGAVIRLKAKDDNILEAAQPVVYAQEFPKVGTLDDWKMIVRGQQAAPESMYQQLMTRKELGWKSEQEWRVIIPAKGQEIGSDYLDVALNPEHVDEIYMGCRMEKSHKCNLLMILSACYPSTVLFQATKNSREYRLNFEMVARGPNSAGESASHKS